uniref:Antixoidant peptide n=2 Tax=Odorrana andersonii TaxID=369514 RepID=K7WHR6_ODOAN|nr:antixoidant peptide precursor [Odorrana andersonii]
MFTLKKSLLLLFFLGIVSLSLCEQERDADEEGNEEYRGEAKVENIKRVADMMLKRTGKDMAGCFKFGES